MNILDKIVAQKKLEITERKELIPVKKLEQSPYFDAPTLSMASYLLRPDKNGVIMEFKRRSPSRPEINLFADPKEVSLGYMQAGASALSILTDTQFFGGSTEDLITARKYNYCPILRKDFIIDEYQILEARSMGADTILLISEILDAAQVAKLASFARSLGLEVLLELHSEIQLSKFHPDCNIIGVNNRNLENFVTSLSFSEELFEKLPAESIKISESGIKDAKDALWLKAIGYQGFLIGEQFMRTANPGLAASQFIKQIRDQVGH